jgi:hypothetical protein
VRRGQRNGPTSESASATCAVTVVGQLVDTFTAKSVLIPRFRVRHSGQAFPALRRMDEHAAGD